MTDRLRGVYVAFDRDIRDDDARPLIAAIKMLRGVLKVTPEIVDGADFVARERARRELGEKLWEVLHPKEKEA